jgi:DNA-binding transcriptional regulator YhcF (GntR family)
MKFEPGKTKTAQVADRMRQRIASGEWEVGESIPGLTDLEEQYEVSFGTVRAAQQVLVNEGLLSAPEQGVSTRVIAKPAAPDARDTMAKVRLAYRSLGEQIERLGELAGREACPSALDLRRIAKPQVHDFARFSAAAAALANGYHHADIVGPYTRIIVDDRIAQVNSRRTPGSPWQLDLNRVVVEDAVAVIFVDLTGDHPEFYIAPAQWVRDEVKRRHKEWLDSKGGQRPRNPKSPHTGLDLDPIRHWHRRWDLLAPGENSGPRGRSISSAAN